jgi:hypothetical protein
MLKSDEREVGIGLGGMVVLGVPPYGDGEGARLGRKRIERGGKGVEVLDVCGLGRCGRDIVAIVEESGAEKVGVCCDGDGGSRLVACCVGEDVGAM